MAMPCALPIANATNPRVSPTPLMTIHGTAARGIRSLPTNSSGIVRPITPMIRDGITAHTVETLSETRPVANRLRPKDRPDAAPKATACVHCLRVYVTLAGWRVTMTRPITRIGRIARKTIGGRSPETIATIAATAPSSEASVATTATGPVRNP